MNEQPEALRLADELEMWTLGEPAAAELRRQHDRITTLETALRQALEALERGETQLRYQAITVVKQALGEA